MTLPSQDLAVAKERNLRFEVTWRASRGKKWLTLREGIQSLEEAYEFALSEDCPEVALWVNGGMLYGGSDHPEQFNSIVLQEGYGG